jgi:hypothetical protein
VCGRRSGHRWRKADFATAAPAGTLVLFSYYSKHLAKKEKRQSLMLGVTAGSRNFPGIALDQAAPHTVLLPDLTLLSGESIAGDAMVLSVVRPALEAGGRTTDQLRNIARLADVHVYEPVRGRGDHTTAADPSARC